MLAIPPKYLPWRNPWLARTIVIAAVFVLVLQFSGRTRGGVAAYMSLRPRTAVMMVLNTVVMAAWLLLAVCATGRFWLGSVLAAVPVVALAVANHLKIAVLGEPVTPDDLRILKDVVPLGLRIWPALYVVVPLALLALVALGALVERRWASFRWGWRRRASVAAGALGLLLLVPLCEPAMARLGCFAAIKWDWGEGYRRDGLFISFVAQSRGLFIRQVEEMPAGYGPQMIEDACRRVMAGYEPRPLPAELPDVVVLCIESLSDISRYASVQQRVDCLAHLHAMQEATGRLQALSPTFGGGSVNTDFEVCTGLSFGLLPGRSTVAVDNLKDEIPSIARLFRHAGYDTTAMVSAPPSLFRYGWFFTEGTGFERYIDMGAVGAARLDDIPDPITADRVAAALRSPRTAPKFLYVQFLRNHIPWSQEKYSHPEVVPVHGLRGSEKEQFDVYAQGVYESDLALGRVVDAARASPRPTIVVAFGDHLPGLGAEALMNLGALPGAGAPQPQTQLQKYSVPCVVWSNRPVSRYPDGIIGMNLLAGRIVESTGISHPFYTHFLKRLQGATHGFNRQVYVDVEDKPRATLPEDAASLVRDYQLIQYDMLFGKQFAKRLLFPEMVGTESRL